MKISKSRLRQIIEEEVIKETGGDVSNFGGVAGALGTATGRAGQALDSPDRSEYGPPELAEDNLVGLLVDLGRTLVEWEQKEYPSDEIKWKSYYEDISNLVAEYDPCAHPGEECADAHPDQSHEECIEVTINKDLQEQKENNPWAICTASVGREDKEKYEKCVKSVKKQNKE